MISFKKALEQFQSVYVAKPSGKGTSKIEVTPETEPDFYSFNFEDSDGNRYELNFERLIWDDQYYVALYKNQDLMVNKVVVKPGK